MSPLFRRKKDKPNSDSTSSLSHSNHNGVVSEQFAGAKKSAVDSGESSATLEGTKPKASLLTRATRGLIGDNSIGKTVRDEVNLSTKAVDPQLANAISNWTTTLMGESGTAPLVNLDCLDGVLLDITNAHPGGIAQFMAGRATKLSLLMREPNANEIARKQLRAVAQLATGNGGVEKQSLVLHLAFGVGNWKEITKAGKAAQIAAKATVGRAPMPTPPPVPRVDKSMGLHIHNRRGIQEAAVNAPVAPSEPLERIYQAPILVREVRVTDPLGNDPILMAFGPVEINSVFVQAIGQNGVEIKEFLRESEEIGEVNVRELLSQAQYLGKSTLNNFKLVEQTFLAALVPPAVAAARDVEKLIPVLQNLLPVAAIVGNKKALELLSQPLPVISDTDRDPSEERGVGDLDVGELKAVEYVASGRDIFLYTPWGTRPTTVVTSIIADAVASGKTVLYVSGLSAVSRALMENMHSAGLHDLCLDLTVHNEPEQIAHSLRAGLRMKQPEIDEAAILANRHELKGTREHLREYVAQMHAPTSAGDSPYQLLEDLACLTSRRPGPRTRVRLDDVALAALEGAGGEDIRAQLLRAAQLNAFTGDIGQTAWVGAKIADSDQAQVALDTARLLCEEMIGDLVSAAGAAAQRTGIKPAQSVKMWGEQLTLLSKVALVLEALRPDVFDSSINDLVAATATRAWRKANNYDLPGSYKRRLRKQAKALILPEVTVDDLHEVLMQAMLVRDEWRKQTGKAGRPRVPEGLRQARHQYNAAVLEIEKIQALLPISAEKPPIGTMSFSKLNARLQKMVAEAEDLRLLPERTKILAHLNEKHFGELLTDLANRKVPNNLVVAELELALATTALTKAMREKKVLSQLDFSDVQLLLNQLRKIDKAQVESLAGPVMRAVVKQLRKAQRDNRELTIAFDKKLENEAIELTDLSLAELQLARLARPVTVAGVSQVALLLPKTPYDLVILDGVESEALAYLLPAIGRAKQMVVLADSGRGSGTAVPALASVLPHYALPVVMGQVPQAFTKAINSEGHHLQLLPDGPKQRRPQLILAEGRGVPSSVTGCVDAPADEVDKVVQAVLMHARTRKDESLAVIALTSVHADAIKAALRVAFRESIDLARFAVSKPHGEGMVVTDARSAGRLERDCVIFSVGLGKTPHGMVLHRFGPLQAHDGVELLVGVVGAARRAFTVVSSLAYDEIDKTRLISAGSFALVDLLEVASGVQKSQGRHLHVLKDSDGSPRLIELDDKTLVDESINVDADKAEAEREETEAEVKVGVLYADLVRRLEAAGVVVRKGSGPVRFTLASTAYPDEPVVALLADDLEYARTMSLRKRDRYVLEQLESRGWVTRRIFAIALFVDPKAVTEELLTLVEEASTRLHGKNPDYLGRSTVYVTRTRLEDWQEDTQLARRPSGIKPRVKDRDEERAKRDNSTDKMQEKAPVNTVSASQTGEESVAVEAVDSMVASETLPSAEELAAMRGPRPDIVAGRPLSTYGDDELDELMMWLVKDGIARAESKWCALLSQELGLTRRDAHVDAVLRNVVRRCPLLVAKSSEN